MSIRHGLLALLSEGPKYGYQLRSEFEERTGSTWPLNVGQVYTTLGRLERDGLVTPTATDEEGRHRYGLTDRGRSAVTSWFVDPVPRGAAPRDELAIKLALALTLPGIDVTELIQAQRAETTRTLQGYTRLKALTAADDTGWLLVLDALLFQVEAEIRWLDHCEQQLVRFPPHPKTQPSAAAAALHATAEGSTDEHAGRLCVPGLQPDPSTHRCRERHASPRAPGSSCCCRNGPSSGWGWNDTATA